MTKPRSYFTPRGRLLEWITSAHRALYRATGGLVGQTLYVMAEDGAAFPVRPMPVLLLTTTGNKSGLERTVPLPYFEHEGRLFLVASFSGGARHPAWYLNLQASPEIAVQIGPRARKARAVALEGAERERIFHEIAEDWPRYRAYQDGTTRVIPVVEIVFREGESAG